MRISKIDGCIHMFILIRFLENVYVETAFLVLELTLELAQMNPKEMLFKVSRFVVLVLCCRICNK